MPIEWDGPTKSAAPMELALSVHELTAEERKQQQALYEAILQLAAAIKDWQMREQDLTPLIAELQPEHVHNHNLLADLANKIAAIEAPIVITEPPDFTQVIDAINALEAGLDTMIEPDDLANAIAGQLDRTHPNLEPILVDLKKAIDKLYSRMSGIARGGGGGGSGPSITDPAHDSTLIQVRDNIAAAYAVKTTVAGAITYVAKAQPGTAQADAEWQAYKVDETSGTIITWADGNADFDNIATDLTTLSYS